VRSEGQIVTLSESEGPEPIPRFGPFNSPCGLLKVTFFHSYPTPYSLLLTSYFSLLSSAADARRAVSANTAAPTKALSSAA
jgi:hypothetical protein